VSNDKVSTLLQAGIAAAKKGDKAAARQVLTEAIRLDPNNELAWLWLSGVMELPHDTLRCLQRVLEINPNNTSAQAGLKWAQDRLGQSASPARPKTEPGKSRPETNRPAAPQTQKPATPIPQTNTVLVVDDSPTVRRLVALTLEKSGYRVLPAADGMAALGMLHDGTIDLVLLDITMPRMDGYQLCKLIKENEATKHIPVVMLSGKDGFFDKVRGRMAGSSEYITKPFEKHALLEIVHKYTNHPGRSVSSSLAA
jgi:twitching motility two-component system response regulator PilG